MKIAIGSDHAGYSYKQQIIAHLKEKGHEVVDFGTHSPESTDYPLWIIPTAEAVVRGEAELGIVPRADPATVKQSRPTRSRAHGALFVGMTKRLSSPANTITRTSFP